MPTNTFLQYGLVPVCLSPTLPHCSVLSSYRALWGPSVANPGGNNCQNNLGTSWLVGWSVGGWLVVGWLAGWQVGLVDCGVETGGLYLLLTLVSKD